MKEWTTLCVNVFGWSLLAIGGMGLAGWLSPSATFYPIILVAGIVPALLFMKFRLPISWHEVGAGLSLLIAMGLILLILRHFQIERDLDPMILIVLVVLVRPFLDRKEENDSEPTH